MALLFLTFILLLLIGMPVGFCLFSSSVIYMLANNISFFNVSQQMIAGVDSFPLLAVPFFILAGNIMNKGGITQRIFDFVGSTVQHYRGGMAHANVLASVIFSGMSGSAIADTGGLGAIELKAMKKAGYDEDFSLAVTGASSIIGPIIPPSIPIILFAISANASVGQLFIAGIIPGLVIAGMMGLLNYWYSIKRNYEKKERVAIGQVWYFFRRAFLSLLTPFIILFGIFTGIYTATEAAIVAVIYALLLGFLYKDITLTDIPKMLKETLTTTSGVFFIIASAQLFAWILVSERIPQQLASYLVSLTSNKYILLLIINITVLFLGLFLDITPAIVILTPIFVPILTLYNISVIHFGIIFILNLMIGLLTPPVGMILFVLSSVAQRPVEYIAKAIWPYILGCIFILFVLTFFPIFTTLLPKLVFS